MVVSSVRTSVAGTFAIELAPGLYDIKAQAGNQNLRPVRLLVRVRAGAIAHVLISFAFRHPIP